MEEKNCLYHSEIYLGRDFSDGIYHYKYIRKEIKNGHTYYIYDETEAKNMDRLAKQAKEERDGLTYVDKKGYLHAPGYNDYSKKPLKIKAKLDKDIAKEAYKDEENQRARVQVSVYNSVINRHKMQKIKDIPKKIYARGLATVSKIIKSIRKD